MKGSSGRCARSFLKNYSESLQEYYLNNENIVIPSKKREFKSGQTISINSILEIYLKLVKYARSIDFRFQNYIEYCNDLINCVSYLLDHLDIFSENDNSIYHSCHLIKNLAQRIVNQNLNSSHSGRKNSGKDKIREIHRKKRYSNGDFLLDKSIPHDALNNLSNVSSKIALRLQVFLTSKGKNVEPYICHAYSSDILRKNKELWHYIEMIKNNKSGTIKIGTFVFKDNILDALKYFSKLCAEIRYDIIFKHSLTKLNILTDFLKQLSNHHLSLIEDILKCNLDAYCGSYDKMVNDFGHTYIYYERPAHELFTFDPLIRKFKPTKLFDDMSYIEKCRQRISTHKTDSIFDINYVYALKFPND